MNRLYVFAEVGRKFWENIIQYSNRLLGCFERDLILKQLLRLHCSLEQAVAW